MHRIGDVCEAQGVTLPQAAMALPLHHPAVAGNVVGVRSAEAARRNVESFGGSTAVGRLLRGQGLLDERVPVNS
jgi:D-threo-aldose 1-dehydrogenase